MTISRRGVFFLLVFRGKRPWRTSQVISFKGTLDMLILKTLTLEPKHG